MITLFLAISCSPCQDGARCVDQGWYYLDEPQEPDGTVLLWIHGYNEDATHLRGKAAEHQRFLDAGWTIVQPQGSGMAWNFQGPGRDEVAFLDAVLDDIGGDRVVASGHSVGSSMANIYACETGRVDVLAPFAGTFWDPLPAACVGDRVPFRHVHGSADETWPLEGRSFVGMSQGAVDDGVAVWRAHNGCAESPETLDDGRSTCTIWSCDRGAVRYCLHDGKHRLEAGFADRLLEWEGTLDE